MLLAKLFTQPGNLLILDEPTNDLDIETLELLEELLANYDGTLLLISHDRTFLNNLVTSTLVFEDDGGVSEYVGGYDDWLRQRKSVNAVSAGLSGNPVAGARSTPRTVKKGKLAYKEKQELEQLPEKIARLETSIAEIHQQMADPEFFKQSPAKTKAIQISLESHEQDLETAFSRWEELEEKQAQLAG